MPVHGVVLAKVFLFLSISIYFIHTIIHLNCAYIIQLRVVKAVFARSVMAIFVSVVFP